MDQGQEANRRGEVRYRHTAKIHFTETPFCVTLDLRFAGEEVSYDAEFNVAFGPTRQPRLVGHAGPGLR